MLVFFHHSYTANNNYMVFAGVIISLLVASLIIFLYARVWRGLVQRRVKRLQAEIHHTQQLLYITIQLHEQEWVQINKEMQSQVSGPLFGLRLMVSGIRDDGSSNEKAKTILEDCKSAIDRMIGHLRDISNNLSPAGLELWGFQETLEDFYQKKGGAAGLSVRILDHSSGILKHLAFDVSLHLFRVMQELLADTIKQASATQVIITINIKNNAVMLQYADDRQYKGAPCLPSGDIQRLAIQSRLSLIHGKYHFLSPGGKWFLCRVELPLSF
ncbi:MAG: sensor histidine kinase [Mucilaginibacter sp.]